jgi:hypothetical protein
MIFNSTIWDSSNLNWTLNLEKSKNPNCYLYQSSILFVAWDYRRWRILWVRNHRGYRTLRQNQSFCDGKSPRRFFVAFLTSRRRIFDVTCRPVHLVRFRRSVQPAFWLDTEPFVLDYFEMGRYQFLVFVLQHKVDLRRF